MATSIELSKLITLKAAYLLSKGLPFSKEVAAMKVTTEAVQILGGKGYLVENQAERFMRNAKILQIFEGTNEIQKLVISGYILKE
jgi:butyryl-CoA dehydrogenase